MATKENLPPMSEITITVMGPDQSLLKAMPESTLTEEEKQTQFLLIRDYLWHSGDHCNALTTGQAVELYTMADGYGPLDADQLADLELMWDWSHIRDSSPMALEAIHARLKMILKKA